MKRDMDLVRAILLAVESKSEPSGVWMKDIIVGGYTDSSILGKHFIIMAQEGFFVCETQTSSRTPDRVFGVMVFDLTWKGHDYLDNIRDPKIWSAAKVKANQIGGAGFDLMLEIAKAIAKQQLTKLGIET